MATQLRLIERGIRPDKQVSENDADSWQVRAFKEETTAANNLMGYWTWPPLSYACTFCGREFRSSQTLGGHMNVHRQDRAKLLHNKAPPPPPPIPSTVASLSIPTMTTTTGKEFLGNEVCLLYPFPNHYTVLIPPAAAAAPVDFSSKEPEQSSVVNSNDDDDVVDNHVRIEGSSFDHELDLELRLGYKNRRLRSDPSP